MCLFVHEQVLGAVSMSPRGALGKTVEEWGLCDSSWLCLCKSVCVGREHCVGGSYVARLARVR